MSKKFKVIVNTGNADNNQTVEVTQGQGARGQVVRLKAKAGAKYQLLDLEKAKAVGPDYVKVKRVGKNLHILFENSTEADVIIEDYYDVMPEGYNGVVGQAENGNFYEYIPEDPDVKGLIPQLADGGQAVSVALGGAEVVGSGAAVAILAFNPLLAGLGLLGAGAAAAAAGGGGGGATPVTGQKTALAIDPISGDNIITVTEGNATNIVVTGRVTGAFKEGDVVELVVNNKTYATTVKADGTFSVPVAVADLKADADTKIDGSINGTGGDRGTASQDYQVLTQGGPTTTALAIDPVTGDNVISAAENTGNIAVTGKVSGQFSAGDVVTLIVNGKTFTGIAAANGSFSINVPAADLVADANTQLEGRVTGTGGTAAEALQDYALADNITPVTSKTALRLNSVTADNVITAAENTGAIPISGTVSGTFAAGDVVTLTVNGKTFTGAAAANGTFSINVPAADLVADSDTMIEARVSGTGGDTVNAVQDYSTTLDGNNADKTALAIDPISGDNIISVAEGNASSLLVTGRVTGVFKEGDVVSLVLNNRTYGVTVNADGTFSVPVAMSDLKADADTQIEGSIAGTGGSIAKAAQDYQVLTQGGPATTALAIDPVTSDNIIGAAENTDSIAVTGRVSGTFVAGDLVTLTVNGKNFTGTASSTGTFTINVPAADLVADSDTAVEGRVTGTGGSAANAIQDYALDSNINPAPQDNKTALVINPITGDNVITATEGNATNITVTGKVTGAFRAGDVVTLVLNNQNITTTAAADGTFSVSVLSTDLKADADTQIEGRVTGTGGSAATAAQDYTVETSDTPTQTALSINPVTADNIINAAENTGTIAITGTVTGRFATGDVVTLTVNSKTFTGTAASNGSFSINVPASDLVADSDTAVDGRVTGTGGTAATAMQDYAVDTTAPTASVKLDKLTPDNIISAAEAGQANLPVTGTVTGDFKAGDVVTVQVNGKPFTTTVQANGSFSVNVPTSDLLADPDKKYEVSVALTDSAGNTGTATAANTYNTSGNTPVGVKTALSLDPISGDNVITATEGNASSITVTGKVTGTFTQGDTVNLSLNGKIYAATVAADGSFSVPVSMVDFKADVDTQIEASITGTGGDTATAAQDYTVESSNTPTQTALSINPVTADNVLTAAENTGNMAITGTVSGKFATGDVVTLTINGKTFTGTATSSGSYSINVPAADLAADPDTKIEGSVSGTGGTTANAIQDYALDNSDNSNNKVAITLDPVTGDNIVSTSEAAAANTTLTGKVTGAFTAGDTVTLSLNNKTFTTTAASDGSYSFSVPTSDLTADADTKADVSVSATSGVVTRTATNSQDYSVQTSAGTGVALSVDTVTADNIINSAESGAANTTITGKATGTFAAGDTVTLSINNKTFTGTVNAQGNYSISVPTTDLVADSDTQVDARITTSAGTATAIQNYAVDTTAPTATVTLDKLTPDNIISAAEAGLANQSVNGTVTGDFKPGDVVTVQVNGKPFTTTVAANGSFSVNVPTSDLLADPDKKYEVSVALTDSAGNTGTATAANDYDVSGNSTKTALTINPITGDNIITPTEGNATNITVSGKVTGTFAAGDVITLSLNNKNITTTAAADGTFSVSVLSTDLKADADTKIEGSVTGTGGSAATAAQDYTVETGDTPTQTALSINPVTADNIINAAENTGTIAITGTVSGRFATGDVVTLTVNSKTFTGTATSSGSFSINVPASDLVADSDTAVDGRVTGTGGTAATAMQDYAVDTSVPTTTVDITAISTDSGTNGDFITNDNNGLTISATLSTSLTTGEKLFYSKDNGVTWTDISASVTGTAVSHIDGTLTSTSTIRMQVRDAAGNTGPTDIQLITIDTVAPAPVVNPEDPLNPPAGKASITVNDVTADNNVDATEGAATAVAITGTIRGEFKAGDVVTLTINSKTFTGTAAANGTFSINVPGSDLRADSDKTIAATVAATDVAGNVGTISTTKPYSADNISLTTTVDITAISRDSGTSSSDFITNDNDGLTLSATLSTALATGQKLFYSKDNGVTWTDITTSVSGTAVSHIDNTLTSTTTVRMRVQDGSGNVGASDIQLITIDTVAPAPVVNPDDPLNPPAGKASITVNDITADNTVNTTEGAQSAVAVTGTVRGEFKAGDVVTLTVNSKIFTGTAAANGTFSINVPGADLLADSDKTVSASVAATDVAGNVGSVTGTKLYNVDSNAPTTTVDITAISRDSGTSNSDFITNDNDGLTLSATLSSALATGEKLFYSKDNGVTWTDITASVSGTAVSHIDDTLTSTSTIRMQVRNAVGSAGATDSQLITIDTVAPAPVVNPDDPLNPPAGKASITLNDVTADNVVNSSEGAATAVPVTGTVRGDFKAGDVVTLTINSKTFTGTAAANGSFSINVPGADLLADSDKTIAASVAATDVAGNVGSISTTKLYSVDTTPPTTTVDITAISLDSGVSSSDFITNDNNGLTISATLSASLLSGEKLFYSKDNGVTWTDITGSVSGTVVSHTDLALTSTSTIQMQVRDGAGNAGAADSQLVTIDTVAPAPVVNPDDPLSPPAGKASLVLDSITTDNIVNTAEGALANVAITGTARGDFTTGDVVTLTVNSKTFTGSVAANGSFSINVPGSDLLADSDKTVDASLAAKDKAGNVGTVTDTQVYTTDTSGPTTTVDITAISTDSGTSATDFITNDNDGLTISATLSASLLTGEKLFYSKDNGVTWTDITTSVSGTVVSHFDSSLTSTNTIRMQVRDGVGNAGATDTQLVTIDTVAPAPVVNPDDPLNPPAGKASITVNSVTADNIVNTTEGAQSAVAVTGTVRGEFKAGDVVTLVINSKTFTGTAAANGSFSINVPGSDLLADSDKTIAASVAATDVAGNVGSISTTKLYSTDSTAPTTTVDITAISEDTGTSSTDFITKDNDGLVISATLGSALATGEKLFYSKDNGVTWTDITTSVSGTTVTHADATLTSTSTIQMQVRDEAGNAGPTDTQLITIDTVAPAPVVNPDDPLNPTAGKASIVLNDVTSDNIVNSAEGAATAIPVTGTVRGEFKAGDVVTLTINSKTFTSSVAANGSFSINVPGSDLLADSDKTIAASVAATDVAGNVGSISTTKLYSVDTTPPTTTVDITAISEDTGTSSTDFITKDNNGLVISATLGSALATGEKLFYSKDNGVTWTDITGSVSGGGTGTSVSHTDNTLTSTSTIRMQVRDAAGNANAGDSQLVTIDTVAPTPVVSPEDPLSPPTGKASLTIDSITTDNIVNAAEGALANVAITGTARGEFKAGDVVTLTVNSKTFTGSVAANGSFSINVPGSDLTADADKTVEGSLAATDVAGNVGNITDTQVYTVDTNAPTITVDITGISEDTGTSATDFITKDNNGLVISATLSTSLAVGEKLFYSKDNGTTWTDITGSVSGTVVSHTDLTLTSTNTIQMQVRDAAGNAGAADSQLITIDTTAPAPVVNPDDPLNPPAGKASLTLDSITADNVINSAESAQANVAITGTARGEFKAGDVVTLTVNSKTFTGSVAANGSFSINVPGSDLTADADKTVDASLAATDVAGNVGNVTDTQVYTVDTTPPTTTVDITAISEDRGTSGSDFITNDNNGFVISATLGSALATGEKLFYSKDNGTTWTDITGSATGTVVSHTDLTLTSTSTIRMQVRDAAGNANAGDSQLVTIDTTAPAPVVNPDDPLNPPAGKASLTLDSITADNTVNAAEGALANVAITGTARGEFKSGDVVTLTVNSKTFTGSVAANGSFSINVPGSDLVADADKTVEGSLAATDVAGNVGNVTDTQVYNVDTNAPTTTVDITAISEDRGTSSTDFITNDNNGLVISATLSASLASGEKLFYSKDNGTTWTDITTSVSGTQVTHTDSTLTSTNTIQMQVRDGAGNAGAADSQLITIDTTAPAPVVSPDNPLNPPAGKASITVNDVTADNTVNIAEGALTNVPVTGTVRGEFKAGDVVTLTINSKTFTGTAAANGSFSINVPGTDLLADSDKTIDASVAASDVAGNVGTISTTKLYSVDTSAPTTTVDITRITDDTGVSDTDFITKDNNGLTISATLSAALATGEKLFYSNDNGVTWTDITTSVSGTSPFTAVSHVDSTLTSTNTIRMQVRDAAGNAGASDTQLVTIDTSAPTNADVGLTVSISSDTNNDGTVSATELGSATTFTSRISVNSNAKVGDTVVINATNGSTAQTAITRVLSSTDISNGFDVTFNTPAVDVTQTVTANYVDAAGNAATDAQATDNAKLGASNIAPVANPETVQNAFMATTGPEVTITDSVSAATVANATDVTFTLTFNEAIKASTLTEADLSVTNGTLKAGTLTKVSDTVWTVQATTASTGSNGMALTLAEGSYTNSAGVTGNGGTGVQAVSVAVTTSPGTEINGTTGISRVPTGWTIVSGSPDINNASNSAYSPDNLSMSGVNGTSLNGGEFVMLAAGSSFLEKMSTSLTNLVIGQTYIYGVQWQQANLANQSIGGQLKIEIGANSAVFSNGTDINDGWTTALISFVATGTSATVVLGVNGTVGEQSSFDSSLILVDSLSSAQIQAAIDSGTPISPVTGGAIDAPTNPTGTTGPDNLVGSDLDNTITAAGGADRIFAGAGNDTVIINTDNVTQLSNSNSMLLDGGSGVNTLTLANTAAGSGVTLDLTNTTVLGKVSDFSSIDITGPTSTATNNTLKLDWRAVSKLAAAPQNLITGVNELLVVNGNAGDALTLVSLGSWTPGVSTSGADLAGAFGSAFNFVSGSTYTAYTLSGVTVYVNDAITLSNATSSTTAFTPATNAKSVQELFGPSFTDEDSGQTFKGVAITSAGSSTEVSASGRHYDFSTDGGTAWTTLAAELTDGTAVFLAPTALIRFVDAAGAAAPIANVDLKARLVDSSGQTGTASLVSGNTVDASTNGGSTAFSGSPVIVSQFNEAPVANPESVTNAFAVTTGPEVTITDNAPGTAGLFVTNGTTVAQGVVRFTLTFSESIKASTLTESDLTVTTGGTGTGAALVAGSLARVGTTNQWTVDVKMPTSGAGTVSLNLADGSYTNTVGVVGDGNAATQWYGTQPASSGNATATSGSVNDSQIAINTDDSSWRQKTTVQLSNGNIAVPVYNGADSDGIFVRLFSPDGTFLGATSVMNQSALLSVRERSPKLLATSDGGFILGWAVYPTSTTNPGAIWTQKFNASGVAQGSLVQIASDKAPSDIVFESGQLLSRDDWQIEPVGTSGNYVVTYSKISTATITSGDTTKFDVVSNLYNASGTLIRQQTLGDVEAPSTADTWVSVNSVGTAGSYVVAWMGTDSSANGGDRSVYVQKFNADGTTAGSASKLEAPGVTNGKDFQQLVTSLGADGSYAVTWVATDSSGLQKVFSQRFDSTNSKVGGVLELGGFTGTTGTISNLTVSSLANGAYQSNWTQWRSSTDVALKSGQVSSSGIVVGSTAQQVSSTYGFGTKATVISSNGEYAYARGNEAGVSTDMGIYVFNADGSVKSISTYKLPAASTLGGTTYDWFTSPPVITPTGVDGEFTVSYDPFVNNASATPVARAVGVVKVNANGLTSSTTGTSATDTTITGEYDDTVTAGGGADIIRTGAGNDTVILNTDNVAQLANANSMLLDGGTGVNTLRITNTTAGTGTSLDLTSGTVLAKVQNFSSIDITGPTSTATNNTLNLDWRAVATLSGATDVASTGPDESKMLVVNGDAGDTVNLVSLSSWAVSTSQTGASLRTQFGSAYNFNTAATYKAFTLNGATLFVNDAVSVTNAASSTTVFVPVTNAKSVLELFGPSFTDANMEQDFKGVAITSAGTSANATAGLRYQFSVDGGNTWTSLAAGLSDSTAVFLAPNALIRFTDTSGATSGIASVPLTARLVDTSGLTGTSSLISGATVNASTNGGSTAFSGNLVTVNLLNRAPVSNDQDGIVVADPLGATVGGTGATQSLTAETLFGQFFTDPDFNAFAGVMVNGAGNSAQQTSLGKYQFSTNGGTTWTDLASTTSDTSAVYLDKANLIRFVPTGGNSNTAKFDLSVRLVDNSAGNTFTAGNAVDVSGANNGGSTAVSGDTIMLRSSVQANNAPVLTDGTLALAPVAEGSTATPTGAVGTLVSSLTGNINDPDGALLPEGIAITGVDTTKGTLFFSLNGGTTWTQVTQTLSNTNALLLSADADNRVYFRPASGVTGSVSSALTIRGWDKTSGAEGGFADTSTNGGISAFSTATDTVSLGLTKSSVTVTSVVNGTFTDERLGSNLSNVGDVNGDGFDDFVVGNNLNNSALQASQAGYVVFGSSTGITSQAVNAASRGFSIFSSVSDDYVGAAISGIGDVNGDGLADLLVGARDHDTTISGTPVNTGRAYIIYGKTSFTNVNVDSTLTADIGRVIAADGSTMRNVGDKVVGAGDVNGDGIADSIHFDMAAGNKYYVAFGNTASTPISLSAAAAGNGGYTITAAGGDRVMNNAGDVNGDGLADVVIGAPDLVNGGTANAGKAYVVFSQSTGTAINVTELNAGTSNKGYVINGVGGLSSEKFGTTVAGAGDVNGDGIADVVIGDALGNAYVVFGKTTGTAVNVTNLGTNGFKMVGNSSIATLSTQVNYAGDINGDGLADMIIGAKNVRSYVVFGKTDNTTVQFSDVVAGKGGFAINPASDAIRFGDARWENGNDSLSYAGDLNGDGFDDLLVGANGSNVGSNTNAGKVYVIYGGTQFSGVAAVLGTGTSSDELVQGTQSTDTLTGGGGVDRFSAGAGNDTIVLQASDAANLAATSGGTVRASVDGGTGYDSLRLSGGMNLDLTTISNVSGMSIDSNSRIERIERIDMATDTAANTLTLAARDVNDMTGFNQIRTGSVSADGKTWTNVSSGTALSATTRFHQLVVDGGNTDVVNLKSGNGTWTNAGTVNDGTNDYVVWQNTATTSQVIVRSGVTVNSNVTPVVLDLNRDGQIDYSRVLMDANSDGTLDSVLWAGSQDGVLVWDKYHDGQIHHHSQYAFTLFGGNSDLEGLAAGFDTNRDGIFSLKDEQFLSFKVWQDKDQDGVVDAGEMHSLADVGIASIDLQSDGVQRTPVDGVQEAGRSSATTTDGQSILVADASFEFTTAEPQTMDFVNGKAPYVFSAEEMAAMTPTDAQAVEPGVYSLSLGQSLDLSQLVGAGQTTPTALAQIDMGSDAAANVLSLSLADVLSLPASNGVHQLKVSGAANDKLMLAEGEWTDTGEVLDQGGRSYAVYTGTHDSTAQLLIDQQMVYTQQH